MKKIRSRAEIEQELGLDLCPIRTILGQIGDKWSLLAILLLQRGDYRFSELAREIPDVSQRMLTHTLRKLERDGIVSRKVTPTIPPRVDYSITDLGRTISEPIGAMAKWADDKRAEIFAARHKYDQDANR